MQSPEPKPAFRTIQFPEPGKPDSPEAREPKHHAASADTRLLTPQEVATRLGVSGRWVRDHATRRFPRIPALKLGPLLRFRSADIDDFLSENRLPVPSQKRLAGV